MIASSGSARLVSARIRSGIIGNASLEAISSLLFLKFSLNKSILSLTSGLSIPSGYSSLATLLSTVKADFASAITPTSVG